jgi:hypothetical protein
MGLLPESFAPCCKFVFTTIKLNNMDKDKEIQFVGQPIFKQILNLLQAVSINSVIKKYQSDHYYKALKPGPN